MCIYLHTQYIETAGEDETHQSVASASWARILHATLQGGKALHLHAFVS